jgi:hypothetical protein
LRWGEADGRLSPNAGLQGHLIAYAANTPATPRKEEAESQKSNGAGAITSVFYTPPGVPLVLEDKFDHLSTGRFGSNVSDPTLTFAGSLSLYTTNWPYYDKDVQKELGAATLHVRLYVPLLYHLAPMVLLAVKVWRLVKNQKPKG